MCYVLQLQIWAQWVQKVKARARKLREQTQGTGGGPAHIRPLTDTEARVLEITGAAAVDGFAALETPLVPPPQPPQRAHSPTAEIEDDLTPAPAHATSQRFVPGTSRPSPSRPALGAGRPYPARPAPPRPPLTPALPTAPSTSGQRLPRVNPLLRPDRAYLRPRRERQPRPPRAQPAQIVTEAITRNHELFRAALGEAAGTMAAAILQAGADIARAIRSLGAPGEAEYLDDTLDLE